MNNCIFCTKIRPEQMLTETEHFKVVFDIEPIQAGHLLIISKQHFMNISEMPDEILYDLIKIEQKLVKKLYETLNIDGVTIAQNNGNIMDEGTHSHVHLIPRYKNDQFWENQKVILHENDLQKLKEKLKEI